MTIKWLTVDFHCHMCVYVCVLCLHACACDALGLHGIYLPVNAVLARSLMFWKCPDKCQCTVVCRAGIHIEETYWLLYS